MSASASATTASTSSATSKRARIGLATGSTTTTTGRPLASVSRGAHVSVVPATPCPQSAGYASIASSDLMLVSSEARPSTSSYAANRQQVSSRLPLKAAFTSSHHAQPTSWHSVGMGAGKMPLGAQSFFSPPGQQLPQHTHRPAFRPRPSIASVSTACSSVPPSSIFSGRSSRVASSATTASFGSEEPC